MNREMSDEMLVKYLLGEASDAEKSEVQDWIGRSEANKKEFYGFKLLWDESHALAACSIADENAAWTRFKQRTQTKTIALPSPYRWIKAAAAILLLAGGSLTAYYLTGGHNDRQQVAASYHPAEPPVNKAFPGKVAETTEPAAVADVTTVPGASAPVATTKSMVKKEKAVNKKSITKDVAVKEKKTFMKEEFKNPLQNNYNHTKEFICNATPCPLEICIIQTVKCPDGGASPVISTCSVLEPDESGQLRYKAFDKITKNCKATINEIRIRQVNTGETIVLNADSKPATAEDFFSYITGQKKGDILAGIFHSDCDNQTDDCGLTFDNNYGKLILQ